MDSLEPAFEFLRPRSFPRLVTPPLFTLHPERIPASFNPLVPSKHFCPAYRVGSQHNSKIPHVYFSCLFLRRLTTPFLPFSRGVFCSFFLDCSYPLSPEPFLVNDSSYCHSSLKGGSFIASGHLCIMSVTLSFLHSRSLAYAPLPRS